MTNQNATADNRSAKLALERQSAADRQRQGYEFGTGVHVNDHDGWEYSTPGDFWSCSVYVEVQGVSQKLGFTIRFETGTANVLEAYAIDSTGNFLGKAMLPEDDDELAGSTAVESLNALAKQVSDVALGKCFSATALKTAQAVLRELPSSAHADAGIEVLGKALQGADYVHHELQDVALGLMRLSSGDAYCPLAALPQDVPTEPEQVQVKLTTSELLKLLLNANCSATVNSGKLTLEDGQIIDLSDIGSELHSLLNQRQLLAETLGKCITASGIVRVDASFSGPQLMMFGDDLANLLTSQHTEKSSNVN